MSGPARGAAARPTAPASARRTAALLLLSACVACAVLPGCGFRLVGRGTTLPPHIKTIAVPPFRNDTRKEEIEQRIALRLLDEISKRGGMRTTGDPAAADAVISGTVKRFDPRPTQFDSEGRAAAIELTIVASVKFEDRRQGKVLWENPSFLFREDYPVTGDPATYFDRENEAVEEVAADFARSVISTIFEGF